MKHKFSIPDWREGKKQTHRQETPAVQLIIHCKFSSVQVHFQFPPVFRFIFPQLLSIPVIFISREAFRTIMERNVYVYREFTANKTRRKRPNFETFHLSFFPSSLLPAPTKVAIVIRHFCSSFFSPLTLVLFRQLCEKNSHKKIAALVKKFRPRNIAIIKIKVDWNEERKRKVFAMRGEENDDTQSFQGLSW